MAKFASPDKQISSPTRRYKLETVNIEPELLGAGTDELAKD